MVEQVRSPPLPSKGQAAGTGSDQLAALMALTASATLPENSDVSGAEPALSAASF